MHGSRGRSLVFALVPFVLLPALLIARAGAAPPPQDAKPDAAKPDAPPAKPKGLGETAPALSDVEWVQGKSLGQYKRGDIYLFRFMNTGSPNAPRVLREAMALQGAHAKDRVQVVGIFIGQRGAMEPPEVWMKRRPEGAKLVVARDKNDATLKAWKTLIGAVGDQTVVLVDKKGKLAWHGGDSTDLDAALAAVIADDAAALGKVIDARGATETSAKPQFEALNKAARARSWDKVVETVDALMALDAHAYSGLGLLKYQALVSAGKKADAAAYGKELLAGTLHDDEGALNEFAWWIVGPDTKLADSARDNELALSAAERACELSSNQDAAILDTLARANWRLGDRAKALELQKKAVGLAFGADNKALLQKSLDEYLKPPEPKPDVPAPGESGAPGAPPAAPPGGAPPPPPGGDEPKF